MIAGKNEKARTKMNTDRLALYSAIWNFRRCVRRRFLLRWDIKSTRCFFSLWRAVIQICLLAFTTSQIDPLPYQPFREECFRGIGSILAPGQSSGVRVTLLDRGELWDCLSTLLLETGPMEVRLGAIPFKITRADHGSSRRDRLGGPCILARTRDAARTRASR